MYAQQQPYGSPQQPAPAAPPKKRRGREVLIALGVVLGIAVVGNMGDDGTGTGPAGAAAPAGTSGASDLQEAAASGTSAAAGIGDEVQDGSLAFTVRKVETGLESLGDGFLRSEAQGNYVLVHVTVTNIGNEAQMFAGANQTLLDAQGREFDADTGAAVMNVPDSESFLTDINPGNTVNGVLVFDVPEGLTPVAIELRESMFSGGATVSLAG